MFRSIVVGTDGSDTATQAVRQATELARAVGARIELVSAYEPVSDARLREESLQVPADLQWMINPREDVAGDARGGGERDPRGRRRGRGLRPSGRSGGRDPRRRRGARQRPHRRRQQGHDRRQALPAGLGAQQGLPPRALLGADHPDGVRRPAASSPRRRRRGRRRSSGRGPGGRGRARCARGGARPRPGVGSSPSTPEASTSAATPATCGAAVDVPLKRGTISKRDGRRGAEAHARDVAARRGASIWQLGSPGTSASAPPPGATTSRPGP